MKKSFLKYIAFAVSSLLAPLCISCNGINNGKSKIITTIFPEYDWVMNVLGDKKDNFDVSMLLDSGVDLHSYSPTPKDIVEISNCDMFVYVGGESDAWVDDVLKDAKNKDMKVINLMEVLGDKAKEEDASFRWADADASRPRSRPGRTRDRRRRKPGRKRPRTPRGGKGRKYRRQAEKSTAATRLSAVSKIHIPHRTET